MRSPEEFIFGALLLGGATWLITKYYWLRVVFCGLALVIWFSFSIGVPVFLGFRSFADEQMIMGALQIAFCVPLGFFWLIGAHTAWKWYKWQSKYVGFWQPWNSE
jgi:hypothetical protein